MRRELDMLARVEEQLKIELQLRDQIVVHHAPTEDHRQRVGLDHVQRRLQVDIPGVEIAQHLLALGLLPLRDLAP